jgi:hypothetical protein
MATAEVEASEDDVSPRRPDDGRRVRFDPIVRVAMLPQEQRVDAKKARRGLWKPGPPHDELWDGDVLDFREQELTPEEFKQLMRKSGNKRSSLPRTFQNFRRLLAVASDKLTSTSGRFAGVDMVGARARLSEDFDEDEREEVIPDKDDAAIRRDESTTSSGRSGKANAVRVSYIDFEKGANSPNSSPTHRAQRVTKFEPSPPSGPSPSQLKAAIEVAPEKPDDDTEQDVTNTETTLNDNGKKDYPKQPILVRANSHRSFNAAGVNQLLVSKETAIVGAVVFLIGYALNRFVVRITVLRVIAFLLIVIAGFTVLISQSKGEFAKKA